MRLLLKYYLAAMPPHQRGRENDVFSRAVIFVVSHCGVWTMLDLFMLHPFFYSTSQYINVYMALISDKLKRHCRKSVILDSSKLGIILL